MAGERGIVTAIFFFFSRGRNNDGTENNAEGNKVYEWIWEKFVENEYEVGYFCDDFEMTLRKLY